MYFVFELRLIAFGIWRLRGLAVPHEHAEHELYAVPCTRKAVRGIIFYISDRETGSYHE